MGGHAVVGSAVDPNPVPVSHINAPPVVARAPGSCAELPLPEKGEMLVMAVTFGGAYDTVTGALPTVTGSGLPLFTDNWTAWFAPTPGAERQVITGLNAVPVTAQPVAVYGP